VALRPKQKLGMVGGSVVDFYYYFTAQNAQADYNNMLVKTMIDS
jgi:hypothetical protein